MKCDILSKLYVRTNGEIVCDCDAGDCIPLGRVSCAEGWSLEEVLHNQKYEHIRQSFANSSVPWEGVCEDCAFLTSHGPMEDSFREKIIRLIHIEPSMECDLACPGCNRLKQRHERPPPYTMSLDRFYCLLRSCAVCDYGIDTIEFCGQGESLSHPQFSEFVWLARSIFPTTKQRLVTNANYDYRESIKGAYIDEIFVSCDGLFQESYAKYRINGSVEKALRFMRDAKMTDADTRPIVVWKYILFEFNDSDEELRAAQEAAMEMNIDSLTFVLTHTRCKSKKYSRLSTADFPLISPIACMDKSPGLARIDIVGHPVSDNDSRWSDLLEKIYCVIEDVGISENGFVSVKGWAMGKKGEYIREILVYWDCFFLGKAELRVPRQDVLAAYPGLERSDAGFVITGRVGETPHSRVRLTFEFMLGKGTKEVFAVLYNFSG